MSPSPPPQSNQSPRYTADSMTRLPPFSSLLSPLEPLINDFGRHVHDKKPQTADMALHKQMQRFARLQGPLSPPISPETALDSKPESSGDFAHVPPVTTATDPLLYPEYARNTGVLAPALFPQPIGEEVKDEIRADNQAPVLPAKSRSPDHTGEAASVRTKDETQSFRVQPGSWGRNMWDRNAAEYLRLVVESNNFHRSQIRKEQMHTRNEVATVAVPPATTKSFKVAKPGRSARPQTPKPSPLVALSRVQRLTPIPPRKAPRSATPHDKTPPKKKIEDVDFSALIDLSPPIPATENFVGLKVDVPAANPLDLSSDPHREQLDPQELDLASSLRLSCATYLCSKRRIFLTRVERLKVDKEFRKTDAQQACKIDVNKASKLWTAYDKAGMFQKHHFTAFL